MDHREIGPAPLEYDDFLKKIAAYFYHEPITASNAYLRAKLALLDSLGCAIESYVKSAECRAMLGPVVKGSVIPGGCRLPGTSHMLDPLKASFDLGTLIRYLDHNDGYIGQEWGHPSDMLGALITIADWQCRSGDANGKSPGEFYPKRPYTNLDVMAQPQPGQPVSVRALLHCIIKAYEVHCLFQHLNSFNKRGLDHTILVKVGAVVGVCWLLGLTEEQALAALSQVYQDGGMLRTYRQSPNTSPRKGWAAGDACMRAVHLALLTRAGQPGAPTVLTEPRWGFYTTLNASSEFQLPFAYGCYAIQNTGFKLVAAEGHGISACNAALELSVSLKALGVQEVHSSIQRVNIRTMKPAITIIDKQGPLRNRADRDHCLSYMVAVTLLKGSLPTPEDYADDSPFATDDRVESLRQVTRAYEDAQLTADYFDPEKRTLAAGVSLVLTGGDTIGEILVEAPLGHTNHPDTNEAVMAKFRANVRLMFDPGTEEKLLDVIERHDEPVSALVDLLWKGGCDGARS